MKTKNRKLSKGMTLVEVLVSMTIFAVMASAILTVIAFANKTANRSKMRDVELATEANIISRKNKASDQLDQVKPNGYAGNYSIVFTPPPQDSVKTINNVKVYETQEGEFNADFDFKMKTVIDSTSLNGLTINSVNDNEYAFTVNNNLSEPITIDIEIKDGFIFEGTGRQYIHTRQTYTKTIPANGSASIGYCTQNFQQGDIKIEATTAVSGSILSALVVEPVVNVGSIKSDIRKVNIDIGQEGVTPVLSAHTTYPDTW
jgi:prepilin-type N-terminal cleavage/methylation domain-containing protein